MVEFDPNIFKVSLSCLENRGELATGDAEFCTNCGAAFNSTSSLIEQGEQQLYYCAFCHHSNKVMIEPEEIPPSSDATYLLEAAAQVQYA